MLVSCQRGSIPILFFVGAVRVPVSQIDISSSFLYGNVASS